MSQITRFLLGTGAAPVETLTGDVGAPAVPSAGNINILGGENINTATPGGGSDVIINLNRIVNLPNTNAAGTEGQYQLGGNRFVHNYGIENTFVGRESGNLTLTGNANTGVGYFTLNSLTTGSENTFLGFQLGSIISSGNANTGVGYNALVALDTGSNNIALGHQAGSNYAAAESDNIIIGNTGTLGDNATIRIGSQGQHTSAFFAGIYNVGVGAQAGITLTDSANQLGTINGTNGQIPIAATGGKPTFASLTSTGSTISFTPGANSLNIETGSAVATSFSTDAGSAIPAAGVLTVTGGNNIATSGAGSTVTISLDGTTNNAVQIGNISGSLSSVAVGTNGQVLIGATGGAPAFASLTSTGGTIAFTTGPNSLNLEVVGGGSDWIEVTAASATMDSDTGYVTNNAGGVVLTLPAVAAFGSVFRVVGKNASGWLIAQNAGQTIHFGTSNTTTGVAGSLQSTAQYDCVELVCITANTDFVVRSSIGNITVT
jgi:hypothetical protein